MQIVASMDGLSLQDRLDPAVALLEDHERLGQIEVNEAVTKVVQIQAFGSHIGTEQHAQRII